MNTVKNIIAAVIIIFCNSFGYAQNQLSDAQKSSIQSHALAQHQRALKKSEYIFEGTVTKQERYYDNKGEFITCNIISITKIFKGSPLIKLGKIKVLTEQGGLAHKAIDEFWASLEEKGTYIILGSPADSSILNNNMILTDNSIILFTDGAITITNNVYRNGKLVEQSHAEWEGGRWNPGTSYKSLEDLYAFFKENDLTVQEEVKQPQQIIVPTDSIKQKKPQ